MSVLRLGTRASRLALWQTHFCAARLRRLGVRTDIVVLTASGDRDLSRPIPDLPSAAPFSDDIERALLEGRIDAAVHCLKDLPLQPTPGLSLAAVLKRGDPREALVSRDGRRLNELPVGAAVGTSSPRRAAQLRALRPDLVPRPIRGPVEDRVRQVRTGHFDAAVLAVAGLQRLGLTAEIAEVFDIRRLMPAPAQAALVIQVRADDRCTAAAIRPLDHAPTRLAVTAELEFQRHFDGQADVAVAALATVGWYGHLARPGNGRYARTTLHARLLRANGQILLEVS